ncbi:MAG: hypothetical protein A2Y57_01260 [Candidatus Woykebacteria bacterium RBG_13_40_7b]|uniref:Uncharacterized protein n=1 Tax=Candidatus Woykebacteria bacterium RBG_13_40_7b TaxID=1802594 RepID=A0A1G1W9Z2_9BACT|nr:MAG: hypothetical protein A2Y57_01260 [Candidatus Woykebacteria bacterium RBG_13_40_7b]
MAAKKKKEKRKFETLTLPFLFTSLSCLSLLTLALFNEDKRSLISIPTVDQLASSDREVLNQIKIKARFFEVESEKRAPIASLILSSFKETLGL